MRWLRDLLKPAPDPRQGRGLGDSESEPPSALLGRIEASLAELAQARAQLEATRTQLHDHHASELVGNRLAALESEEQALRSLRARLLLERVTADAERAQLHAEVTKTRASVLLGLDEDLT